MEQDNCPIAHRISEKRNSCLLPPLPCPPITPHHPIPWLPQPVTETNLSKSSATSDAHCLLPLPRWSLYAFHHPLVIFKNMSPGYFSRSDGFSWLLLLLNLLPPMFISPQNFYPWNFSQTNSISIPTSSIIGSY